MASVSVMWTIIRFSTVTIVLLLMFVGKRNEVNFGSPYRVGQKSSGHEPSLNSADIIALDIWRLKSSGHQ